jgi:hypothetical protein
MSDAEKVEVSSKTDTTSGGTETTSGGAENISMEKEVDETTITEKEVDELHQRLKQLSKKDRRRTFEQLSILFPEETVGGDGQQQPSPQMRKKQGEHQFSFQGMSQKQTSPSASNYADQSVTNRSKIVVENNYKKLKVFSAKSKPGSGELDYRHWRRAAVRVVEDDDLSESKKKQLILDSLQGKADDLVHFTKNKSVHEIVDLLDSNFKPMVDGDDLLADYYQMIQEEKKSASDYLSDLYVELTEVVNEGGAYMTQMPKLLLNQFIRGIRDDEILNKLRLEDKKSNPPEFPHLMAEVRREECKRTERKLRLKRGSVTRSSAVTVTQRDEADPEMDRLQRRVNKLETMCSGLETMNVPEEECEDEEVNALNPEVVQMQQRLAQLEEKVNKVRSRSVFCYRCGEDGHLATECSNPPNKALVLQKVEKRKQHRKESKNQPQGNYRQLAHRGGVPN